MEYFNAILSPAEQAVSDFQQAIEAQNADAAAIALHKLPEHLQPSARAKLADLRREYERLDRFDVAKRAARRNAGKPK